jgi:hypothetical protein
MTDDAAMSRSSSFRDAEALNSKGTATQRHHHFS